MIIPMKRLDLKNKRKNRSFEQIPVSLHPEYEFIFFISIHEEIYFRSDGYGEY